MSTPWLVDVRVLCYILEAMSTQGQGRYSPTIMDHFLNPRNVGEIPDADGVGGTGDPGCGDSLRVWIQVRDNHLTDVRFRCKGCPAAIACASCMTELAIGTDLDEASEITDEVVEDALGGLPPEKRHCSNLAADALYNAIMDHIVRACDQGLRERNPGPAST